MMVRGWDEGRRVDRMRVDSEGRRSDIVVAKDHPLLSS